MGSSGKLPKLYQQSLVWIFLSHFLFSVESGLILNDFIRHFEPVFYNHTDIIEQHRRFKRDDRQDRNEIRIRFNALNRLFKLRLWSDTSIFTEDASLENSEGKPIPFDVSRIYKGELEDDEKSHAEGIIKSDGTFEGFIHTPNELYYFDSSGSYFSEPLKFQTIAYRHSDVKYPEDDGCASHKLYLKRVEENRGYCEKSLCPSAKNSNSVIQNDIMLPEMADGSHVLLKNDLNDISALRNRNNLVRRKRSQEPLNFTTGGPIDKELYSGWIRGTEGRKRRALIDPKKKTCMLYLQADHLFYNKMGSEEACIESMTRHVQRVNNIYQAIDFDGDGEPDDINFMIKRIKVHTDSALSDTNYRYPGNYGVEKFLELFSEEDYDAFCLAYMFTYRDFDGGTLGLAWTGDLKNAGGVCEKNGHYRGSLKSLNTGIITLLNYGKHVPPAVSHVTLAHEIGHNFGSPHDPENNKDCTPGGEDGNYIMFARATSGDKKNNNKFSPCSLRSINGVLNAKARDSRGCFTEPKRAICGNGVVDPGEECDCGWEEDCKESCCFPMRSNPAMNEKPCTLRPFKVCSPSQGPCCTEECLLKQGAKCREDNGCRDSSYCDGTTAECPLSINKPNKTVCNDEFVCFMGECTGSICLAYGLESCQCLPKPGDPPTKSCELCCKKPGDDQEC
ncbi:hypothetical protein QYM36_016626, partial [Artemia franciscana]